MSENGIVVLACEYSVSETVERLATLLESEEITGFARIDHAAEGSGIGLEMQPTVLLIFGNPKIGTPLMQRHPSIAIDLPTKALIREDADGKVWLSYNSPEYLQQRHGLEMPPLAAILDLLQRATQ